MNYIKFILFLTIMMGISANGYTQNDFGNKAFSIPLKKNSLNTAAPTTVSKFDVPSINFPPITAPPAKFPLDNNPLSSTLKRIGEKDAENFMQEKEFKNPGDVYAAKLNKSEGLEVVQVFRKNQYLGDLKTKSTFVKISCRDHGLVDGDQIRVYINDILIQSRINLDGDFQIFEITLQSGFNKIDFEAINQGTDGPNTAEFQVFDDKGNLISGNQWNLATGFKATLIIVKE